MKNIAQLIMLMVVTIGYAQEIPVTFENDVAVGDNWNPDSDLASVAIVTSPDAGDPDGHGLVGRITSAIGGAAWQNAQLKMTTNYIDLTNATGSKSITFDYYSTVVGGGLLKLESTLNGGGNVEKAFTTSGLGWEEISVDFTVPDVGDAPDDQYSLIVFFPGIGNGNPNTDEVTYVDNINGAVGDAFGSDPSPTADPVPPTENHLLVNAIFSNAPAYIEPQGILYNENWGGSSRAEIVTPVSDNEILKYGSLTYQGIDFTADIQDVSGRTNIRFDYWTNNGTLLKLHMINNDGEETFYELPSLAMDTWTSIEIPLTEYAMELSNVKQLMFVGSGTFYVDNIYFQGGTPSDPLTGTCITTSTEGVDGTFSVGYKATYETLANGSDVKIDFEILDVDKTGLVAFLQKEEPFTEVPMDFVSGQTWTKTITGLTPGEALSYRCKFAFAGGLVNTQWTAYEVGRDCSLINDVTAPDTFLATVGAITPRSVELLLNANDVSGTVVYDVSYGGKTKRISTEAGEQKSLFITALTPSTIYEFDVIASDLAGNVSINSPIELSAETAIDSNTPCGGNDFESNEGVFEIGYNYSFETSGTEVTFTFELLDEKEGVVAYLFRENPFGETPMNLVSGKTFDLTVGGFTPGETISYACKFAFAGGLAVTKYFSYEVGNDCSLSIGTFELENIQVFPNPSPDKWTVKTSNQEMISIEIYNVLGKTIMSLTPHASEITINAARLPNGLYFAKVNTDRGSNTVKLLKTDN